MNPELKIEENKVLELRIMDWDQKYEINNEGGKWQEGAARWPDKPPHVWLPVDDLTTDKMILAVAGPYKAAQVKGLLYILVGIAGGLPEGT